MENITKSQAARLEGNKLYREMETECMGAQFRLMKGKRSIAQFTMALQFSENLDEQLSSIRSLGVVHLKAATLFPSIATTLNATDIELAVYHFTQAMSNFVGALNNGNASSKDSSWLEGIQDKICATVDATVAFSIHTMTTWKTRATMLLGILGSGQSSSFAQSLVQTAIAYEILKAIIKFDEERDWKSGRAALAELHRPLTEALQQRDHFLRASLRCGPGVLMDRTSELLQQYEEESKIFAARCDFHHHLYHGEQGVEQLLHEDEHLDMERAWSVVDSFRAAITAVKDPTSSHENPNYVCHESAAMGFSHLGRMYEKVIKMEDVANKLYLSAIHHADVVTHTSGATFFNKEWYQTAKKGIEEYRKKRLAFDSAQVAAVREPTLIILKPRLDAILAAMTPFDSKAYRAHAVILFLYKNEPPKEKNTGTGVGVPSSSSTAENLVLDRDDKDAMKKAIRNAVASYHPDKQVNKESGIEWHVLCEEITKHLNNLYEYFKG